MRDGGGPVAAVSSLAFVMILVSACSTSPPDGSGTTPATEVSSAAGMGRYKVGKPYQINGIWYYPKVDYEYDEVGIASWYGPGFHGEMTANGEIYDMNAMTAAHKTLPMPSIVRVTNLENGRTVKLRVNDRGPFVGERIIDVSRRAAQMLGFYGAGTARVRVQIEAEESRQIAAAMTGQPTMVGNAAMPAASIYASPAAAAAGDEPQAPKDVAVAAESNADDAAPQLASIGETAVANPQRAASEGSAPASPAAVMAEPLPAPSPEAPQRAVGASGKGRGAHFVQAGAFADPANVARAQSTLTKLGPVEVKPVSVDGRQLMRVRVGPLASADAAEDVLVATVRLGFPASRVVVEK
jgi:rare lipoprotein A